MKIKRILKRSTRAILFALILAFLVGFVAYWRSTNECDRKTAPVNPVKAIVHCEYGGPDVLDAVLRNRARSRQNRNHYGLTTIADHLEKSENDN
jgi:hypothetical protein